MAFFNKLFGLKVLERALSGSAESRVLAWRVYRSPKGIRLNHFTDPNKGYEDAGNVTHLLVRSDGKGDIPEDRWKTYPRRKYALNDPYYGGLASLAQLKREMSEDSKPFQPDIRYVVHGVRPMEDYVLQGRVLFDGERFVLKLGHKTNEHAWRHWQSASEEDNRKALEIALEKLNSNSEPRFNEPQKSSFRRKFMENLLASLDKIKAEIQKSGVHEFEASFAVPALEFEEKGEPVIEWYDLLHLPQGKAREWLEEEGRRRTQNKPHYLPA